MSGPYVSPCIITISALYFLVWLLIGLIIYVAYGYKSKRLDEQQEK